MKCRPIIIIRATQKKMMSCPVSITEVGEKVDSSSVGLGQPSVENGQSADETQVSSPSGSCSNFNPPHLGHLAGRSRETIGVARAKSIPPTFIVGASSGRLVSSPCRGLQATQ